jgi:hypothetical protein
MTYKMIAQQARERRISCGRGGAGNIRKFNSPEPCNYVILYTPEYVRCVVSDDILYRLP